MRLNNTPSSTTSAISAIIRHTQQPQRNHVELENNVPMDVVVEPNER